MTRNCELELFGSIGGDNTDRDWLLKRIEQVVEGLRKNDPTQPVGIHYKTAAERVAAELKGGAADYEKQLLVSLRAQDAGLDRANIFMATGLTPGNTFREVLNAAGNGAIADVQTIIGKFGFDLQREGLEASFYGMDKDPSLRLDVAKELQQLSLPDGKKGITGNKTAEGIAELFRRHVDPLRAQLKDMGLRVADLKGYILKQVWNGDRLLQRVKSAQEFVDILGDRIHSIGGVKVSEMTKERFNEAMGALYEEITGGAVRVPEVSIRNAIKERYVGAVRNAQSRTVKFKTIEDELFVMDNFGYGSMSALMTDTLENLAKDVSLNRTLGINPYGFMDALRERIKQSVGPLKAADAQRDIQRGGVLQSTPEHIMSTITGHYGDVTGSPTMAKLIDTVANWARSVLLVNGGVRSTGDIATTYAASNRLSLERTSSFAKTVAGLFEQIPEELRAQAAGIIEAQSSHALGAMHKYTSDPDIISKVFNGSVFASDLTFKYSGLNWMTRHNKTNAYLSMSMGLADMIDKGIQFGELSSDWKRILVRGNISDKDWAGILALKDNVLTVSKKGNKYLNTDSVDGATKSKINSVLSAFVSGEAVITPDVLTRTIMTQGLKKGTIPHAILQQATFLMGYPISYMRQGFGRQREATGIASFGMFRLAAAATFLGVMQQIAIDIGKNRYQDYEDPEIITRLLYQGLMAGGALTLPLEMAAKALGGESTVSKVFFGQDAKYRVPSYHQDGGLTSFLEGAGVSFAGETVADTMEGIWDLVQGEIDKGAAKLTKTAQRATPLVNLPVVSPVLAALIFDPLMEMFEPGSIDKAKRRWAQRTGGGAILDFND